MEHTRIYRKRRGTNTWHFCKNCVSWPTEDYEEQANIPFTGQLCNECRLKEKDSSCDES